MCCEGRENMRINHKNLVEEQNCICIGRNGNKNEEHSVLLKEHAMDIYTDDEYYLSVTCTEEYLEELVIGRLVADGRISRMEEISAIKVSEDRSCVDVWTCEENISSDMEKKAAEIFYPDEWVFCMADTMAEGMPIHDKTWMAHCCFLFRENKLLFACEDISRHNAVDKVIGLAVKNQVKLSECALYTSGRVPLDLVEKIRITGIPVLVGKGMPTAQAVELCRDEKITLICGARCDRMKVYTDFRGK